MLCLEATYANPLLLGKTASEKKKWNEHNPIQNVMTACHGGGSDDSVSNVKNVRGFLFQGKGFPHEQDASLCSVSPSVTVLLMRV